MSCRSKRGWFLENSGGGGPLAPFAAAHVARKAGRGIALRAGASLYRRALLFGLAMAVLTVPPGPALALPSWLNHQGRVLVDGQGSDGTGHFKFALLDPQGIVLWTNDGVFPEPAQLVPLTLTQGHFSAALGRAPEMVPLPAATLSGRELRLRVWFSSDGTTSVLLSPDLPLGSVPHAFEALDAQQADNAQNAENAQKLEGKSASEFALTLHTHGLADIPSLTASAAEVNQAIDGIGPNVTAGNLGVLTGGANADALHLHALDAAAGWKQVAGAVHLLNGSENVGIGTQTPGAKLDVAGGSIRTDGQVIAAQMGTVTSQALQLLVNNAAALRLEPTSASPNFIGGSSANVVSTGVHGATIGGGGPSDPNDPDTTNLRVSDHFGTLNGGAYNRVGDGDTDPGDAPFATVGGGFGNDASGAGSTIGGGNGNVASGVQSAVGGGNGNAATGIHASIGGGSQNDSFAEASTVAGGVRNFAQAKHSTVGGGADSVASAESATISGGASNLANQPFATVGGGSGNSSAQMHATIGGGRNNRAFSPQGTIGGGEENEVLGLRSTVGGGLSNSVLGSQSTIGGGELNSINASWATIAGGGPADPQDPNSNNRVTDNFGTVGGGGGNRAGNGDANTSNAGFATVGGGMDNVASGLQATIGGGSDNNAIGLLSTIGGGFANLVTADFATISGGGPSDLGNPSVTNNRITDNYGTLGGGSINRVGNFNADPNDARFATVGGGIGNSSRSEAATVAGGRGNAASGLHSSIGGGNSNISSGQQATVGGGNLNAAGGLQATSGGGNFNIASGQQATVSGGNGNTASAQQATVSGGNSNRADGIAATVPGGDNNEALADYSFAAGRNATVDSSHNGAFLFGDSSAFPFASTKPDEFAVRSTGGARFVLNVDGSGDPTWTCVLVNGSSWSCSSDRNLKENFSPVDGLQVLEALGGVPILEWNAKGQDPSIRHFGPMAQDFHAAFSLGGDDDRHISTIDLDGVALAAIQGLHRLVQEQEVRLAALQQHNAALEARWKAVEKLEARLEALERARKD